MEHGRHVCNILVDLTPLLFKFQSHRLYVLRYVQNNLTAAIEIAGSCSPIGEQR